MLHTSGKRATSILDETVHFDNDRGTVLHSRCLSICAAASAIRTHKGPHGLPLIGRADWNDCLNLNCFSKEPGESFQTTGPSEGPVAESVFIAGMFVKYGRDYAEICRQHRPYRRSCRRARRGCRDGTYRTDYRLGWRVVPPRLRCLWPRIGGEECEEGQIFIEPQGCASWQASETG